MDRERLRIILALVVISGLIAGPAKAAGQVAESAVARMGVAPVDTAMTAGRAFLTGAVAGMVAGGVIGAIIATDDDDLAGGYDLAIGLFGGLLFGGLVGGLTGLILYERR